METRQQKFRRDNPDYDGFYHETLRILAFDALGHKCALCGQRDSDVLMLDHIKPIRHRQTLILTENVYIDIVIHKKADNLQLLCANCHLRKSVQEQRSKWWQVQSETMV